MKPEKIFEELDRELRALCAEQKTGFYAFEPYQDDDLNNLSEFCDEEAWDICLKGWSHGTSRSVLVVNKEGDMFYPLLEISSKGEIWHLKCINPRTDERHSPAKFAFQVALEKDKTVLYHFQWNIYPDVVESFMEDRTGEQ